jgi:putative ABC transport system substrate-binding protein
MKARAAALSVALALGIPAAPLAADAQQAGKVPRIGVLYQGSAGSTRVEAFRQGLRDLGYVEGQSIAIEYRYAEGRTERYSDLALEMVAHKVDVIAVTGAEFTQAVAKATKTTPIVFMFADQPVAMGLVASLARPGGNVTGFSSLNAELSAKRLELLKEALPKIRRVAVLRSANRLSDLAFQHAGVAARSLRIQLQSVEVRGPEDLDPAFAAMTKQRAEALLLVPGPLLVAKGVQIADLALKYRLPAIPTSSEQRWGLMTYGSNLDDLCRRAASTVDKILKGTKPPDLPVEQPTKFDFVINLKTAKALGLTIPQFVLDRADEIIQ